MRLEASVPFLAGNSSFLHARALHRIPQPTPSTRSSDVHCRHGRCDDRVFSSHAPLSFASLQQTLAQIWGELIADAESVGRSNYWTSVICALRRQTLVGVSQTIVAVAAVLVLLRLVRHVRRRYVVARAPHVAAVLEELEEMPTW